MGESGSNPSPEKAPNSTAISQSEEGQVRRRTILIVEDSKADLFLIQAAIADFKGDIHIVRDGEQALQFLDRAEVDLNAPCPDLVLLDLNLPKRKGADVLRVIRAGIRCQKALVLIITSSDSALDREQMAHLGANGYFRKPSEYGEFMKLGEIVSRLFDDVGS